MLRSILVTSALACLPAVASAQSATPPSDTRMILGGGLGRFAPVFTLGFETKRAKSPFAWRLMTEYAEQSVGEPYGGGYFSMSTTYGFQLLGVRAFREAKRFQPYVLGGGGMYYTSGQYRPMTFVPDSSGFVFQSTGAPHRHQELEPAFIWGTGVNFRVSKLTLFGEVKMPIYANNAFQFGPHAPLTFGIRF